MDFANRAFEPVGSLSHRADSCAILCVVAAIFSGLPGPRTNRGATLVAAVCIYGYCHGGGIVDCLACAPAVSGRNVFGKNPHGGGATSVARSRRNCLFRLCG